jgi:hypothetical protein
MITNRTKNCISVEIDPSYDTSTPPSKKSMGGLRYPGDDGIDFATSLVSAGTSIFSERHPSQLPRKTERASTNSHIMKSTKHVKTLTLDDAPAECRNI